MQIPSSNPLDPTIHFNVAPAGAPGPLNVGVTQKTLLTPPSHESIVRFISDKVGNRTVKYCRGAVEKTEPNNLDAPVKMDTYFNKELGKYCYKMTIIWEVAVEDSQGKEEILEIPMERFTTYTTPHVNYPNLQKDFAYKASMIGNEYAKTIAAVFDPNHPNHAEMSAAKEHLMANDRLEIKVTLTLLDRLILVWGHQINDDPDVFHKGYGHAEVSWKDSHSGKTVRGVTRNYTDDIYKADKVANAMIPLPKDTKIDQKTILDGVEVLKQQKIDVESSERFASLKKLERMKKDVIESELKKENIEESDWIGRLGRSAFKLFQESTRKIGGDRTSIKNLQQYITYYETLANKPNKTPGEAESLKKISKDLKDLNTSLRDVTAEKIEDLQNFGEQLEVLLDNNPGIKAYWALPGGTSETAVTKRWNPAFIDKKVEYLKGLIEISNKLNTLNL